MKLQGCRGYGNSHRIPIWVGMEFFLPMGIPTCGNPMGIRHSYRNPVGMGMKIHFSRQPWNYRGTYPLCEVRFVNRIFVILGIEGDRVASFITE